MASAVRLLRLERVQHIFWMCQACLHSCWAAEAVLLHSQHQHGTGRPEPECPARHHNDVRTLLLLSQAPESQGQLLTSKCTEGEAKSRTRKPQYHGSCCSARCDQGEGLLRAGCLSCHAWRQGCTGLRQCLHQIRRPGELHPTQHPSQGGPRPEQAT